MSDYSEFKARLQAWREGIAMSEAMGADTLEIAPTAPYYSGQRQQLENVRTVLRCMAQLGELAVLLMPANGMDFEDVPAVRVKPREVLFLCPDEIPGGIPHLVSGEGKYRVCLTCGRGWTDD
jgi:hypothetical protein